MVVILVTITRMSGIKTGGKVDQVWESYFLILAAEVGIILTAVTAFRALFVSRHKRDNDGAKQPPGDSTQWYSQNKHLLKRVFNPSLWRSKSRVQSTSEGYEANEDGHFPMRNLPDIPRAHMTGVRTFIDGRGNMTNPSRIMESQATQGDEDTWPLHGTDQTAKIQV